MTFDSGNPKPNGLKKGGCKNLVANQIKHITKLSRYNRNEIARPRLPIVTKNALSKALD